MSMSQLGTPELSVREKKKHTDKSSHQLRKDLQRTNRVLQCERSQKNALKERLEYVEGQLEDLRTKETLERRPPGSQIARIHELTKELSGCQAELKEVKLKGEKLQEEQIDKLRKELLGCKAELHEAKSKGVSAVHVIPNQALLAEEAQALVQSLSC